MNSYKKAYSSIDAENFSIKRERALFNALIDNAENEPKREDYHSKYFFEDAKREKIYFLKIQKIAFKTFHDNLNNQNKDKVKDENQQLANIQAELKQFFRFKEEDFFVLDTDGKIAVDKDGKKTRRELSKLGYEYLDKEGKSYPSPRARFLIWKYNNLYNQLKKNEKLQPVAVEKQKSPEEQSKEKESKSLTIYSFRKSFDIGKKIVDSMDDMWSGIASHIFPRDVVAKVTPYLMGVVVGIIHLVEAVNGGWIAFKKFSKISRETTPPKTDEEATNKRASDIVAGITGTVAAVIGSAGVALSVTAMVLTSTVLASMLPVLMVGIIGSTLIRRGVRYHHAEVNYYYAKNEIEFVKNDKGEVIKEITKGNKEKKLAEKKARLEIDIQNAEEEAKKNPGSDNRDKVRNLYNQYFEADHEWTKIKRYEEKYEDKKSTFWFNVAELGAALTVAVGVVVGTGASLGTLSAVLGGVGVGSAITTKFVEYLNEKYSIFKSISNWFSAPADPQNTIKEKNTPMEDKTVVNAAQIQKGIQNTARPIPAQPQVPVPVPVHAQAPNRTLPVSIPPNNEANHKPLSRSASSRFKSR